MSSTSVTGLHYEQQQQQQHSIRTKQLRGRGLVAQVLPIEMQTLWYGNWQLQKPARIHTSMYWNHLRNVRCDGTSSPRQHRQMDQTSSMSGAGVRWWGDGEGETEREGGSNRTVGPSSPFYFPLSFFFLSCPSIFFTLVKLPELKCGNLETQRVYSKTKHPIIATGTGGSDLSTSGITDGCNSSQEPNSASLQAKKNLHLVTKTNYSWSECRKTQHFTKMNKSRAATYVFFFLPLKISKIGSIKVK